MHIRSAIVSAIAMILVTMPSMAFFSNDLKITKIRPSMDETYVQQQGITRTVYQLDKEDLTALNDLISESNYLPNLTHIDVTQPHAFSPEKINLKYQGEEATVLQSHYVTLLTEMEKITEQVLTEEQRKIDLKQLESEMMLKEITQLEADKVSHNADIQIVLDRQIEVDRLLIESEKTVSESAAQIAQSFNSLGAEVVGKKGIKPKHFEKVSIKYGHCKNELSVSGSNIKTGTEIEGYCFTTKIPVKKKYSDLVLSNTALMEGYHKLNRIIYNELIKQGEADNKSNFISGYRQEAKAFARGTINNARKAAKQKYGNSDKGFDRKIKSMNTQYKQSLYNIKSAKENLRKNTASALRQSDKFEALKPQAKQLQQDIHHYLVASWQDVLGKPVDKFTTNNYREITLEPINKVTVVTDTYSTYEEIYLINSKKLDEIKEHRDLKGLDGIPTNAAARVDALSIFGGTATKPVSLQRLAHSAVTFLQRL